MREKRGKVIKSTGIRYKVSDEEGITHYCALKGTFRMRGTRTTNPVAVGDDVMFEPQKGDDPGVITRILQRKNYIIRKSPNLSKESQILAANIDQLLLMASLIAPETPAEFIDRMLATAEAYRIPAFVLFNKTDLYGPEENAQMEYLSSVYVKIGYKTGISSLAGKAIPDFMKELLKDKITLIAGNSGVGKSTLINLLNPSLRIKTEDISDYHLQGKHTTTFPEMHPIPSGGFVIDSPGIRGFGVIDMKRNEIYHFFPEIFKASKECRFANCLHMEEPGCAVISSVEKGDIEWFRYRSYLSIMDDGDQKYR